MPTTLQLAAPARVLLRHLETDHEYAECVRLQRETWGESFREIVPAAILKVSQKVAGITAGAFDDNDNLLGFVFGLTGFWQGRATHWSHMLAVSHAHRDHGIGRQLKEFQRSELLAAGVQNICWTYDPLVARNAHLNLNRLGVAVIEYVQDMYASTGSELHRFGTDRLVVCWDLTRSTLASQPSVPAPVLVNPDGVIVQDFPAAPQIAIEVPSDIAAVQFESIDAALSWRLQTRSAFTHYLKAGYRVVAFKRDGANRNYYVLEQPPTLHS